YRDQARILAKRAGEAGSPVLALSLTSGACDPVVAATLSERGVPLLAGARPSLTAIAAWQRWHRQPPPRPLSRSSGDSALPWDGTVLVGKPAMDVLGEAGIAVPEAV